MAGKHCLAALALLLVLAPQGLSKDYDYDDYYYDGLDDQEPPVFSARPQTFTVEVGQSVILPCDVTNIGTNKLIIKKAPRQGGEKLMFVGQEKVTRDRRISLQDYRIHITHARPRDAGSYTCLFDLLPPLEPLELVHSVDVQYAPSVHAVGEGERHVVKGESVSLECVAEGNPQPVISWSRQEGPLPSGKRSEQGEVLTLAWVDRHVGGTYVCTADNGVGEPAVAAITILVEYPPEVSTQEAIVRTGTGDRVELVCIVHGAPVPEVTWARDGHPIEDTDLMDTQLHQEQHEEQQHHHHQGEQQQQHVSSSHTAHRHTLTIQQVDEKDFGLYMCVASNTHGTTNATIQMTGLPKPPLITSSPNGGESDMFTLTWTTDSYYPITEFILKYRKVQQGVWQNHTGSMGSWVQVSRTVDEDSEVNQDLSHAMAHTLTRLAVATDYAATVRVRNKYGWSQESATFTFSTKKAMAVLQSTSNGESSSASRAYFPALAMLLCLMRMAL